ncbi:MAG TPA: OmpA family protein [Rhizobacter sp.]|nr:OmpA family protein [Rhizobacter sp.]
MRRPLTLLATSLAAGSLLLAGCENMSPEAKGTAAGAGIGAATGAVISAATGGKAGVGAAVGGAVGAVAGNIWSKKQEERKRQMEQATQGTGVDVTRTADNQLKLNVPSDISFAVNRADIKPELRSVLDSFAGSLQGDPNVRVSIVGHTDSTGSDAINNPLSVERAQSVRDYLAGRGFPPSRVETSGRGSHEPIADNGSEAGRAKNRRVEIFLREPGQG